MVTNTESDNTLLERMKKGDDAAFEQLFVRHYSQVFRVVYSLLGSQEAAEDLAQETFLELYRHSPASVSGSTLAPWLCRVALNRGYNALRGERRSQQRMERFMPGGYPAQSDDPYTELARAEERALVREVLA